MKVHRLIGIILLLCCVSVARAQSINEVKEKQAKTEKEIAYLNKLLADARKDKSATVQKLNIINRKITKGKEMLRSLESEMQYFDDLITGNEAIRRRAKAVSGEVLQWTVLGAAWLSIALGAPLWVTLTAVGVFAGKSVLEWCLMVRYQGQM